jgi:hypothetical protein
MLISENSGHHYPKGVGAIAASWQAQTAGYFDNQARVNRLKKDTDLQPLRLRADFGKLVAELEDKRITETD